eukprot:5858078-Pyramimonas_sp.AAC.1
MRKLLGVLRRRLRGVVPRGVRRALDQDGQGASRLLAPVAAALLDCHGNEGGPGGGTAAPSVEEE